MRVPSFGSMFARCWCVLALAAPLAAQWLSVGPQTVVQVGDDQTVSGRVLNSVTGEPVPRALVQLNDGRAVFSDHEGNFRFTHVHTAQAFVGAQKPGYFPDPDGSILVFRNEPAANVPLESAAAPQNILLIPEAIVSGTVTDERGAPLPGVSVTLLQSAVQAGVKTWNPRSNETTNSEGEFRFYELQAGEYYLRVDTTLDRTAPGEKITAFLPARYPEAPTNTPGSSFALKAGEQKAIPVHLRSGQLFPVTLTFGGLPARQEPQLTCRSLMGETISCPQMGTGDPGILKIMLPSGGYEVIGMANGPDTLFYAEAPVNVAQAPAQAHLNFSPSATIPVEAEYVQGPSNTNPPAGIPVDGHLQPAESISSPTMNIPPLRLKRVDLSMPWATNAQLVDDKHSNGAIAFKQIVPGAYRLQNYGGFQWHLLSATCGSIDLLREPLVISGPSAGCTLHAVLSNETANVQVTLQKQGKPARGVLYLISDFLNEPITTTLTPNSPPGAFNTIPAGTYRLLAFEHPVQLEYENPAFMQRYAAWVQTVNATPSSTTNVSVEIVPSELP